MVILMSVRTRLFPPTPPVRLALFVLR